LVRIDDLEAALTNRIDAQYELLAGSKFAGDPLPSTLYSLAESDYARGKHPEALRGFKSYIKKFPQGERVPEARLRLGDVYGKQKKWAKAINAYADFLEHHSKNPMAATALFRKGNANLKLGKRQEAKNIYRKVVKNYPYRPEAKLAQDQYRILQSKKSK